MTLVSERGTSNSTESLNHSFKLAVRQLWRSPGYSCTVLFTQALAIGANAAIFSVVNALSFWEIFHTLMRTASGPSTPGPQGRNPVTESETLMVSSGSFCATGAAQSRMCPKRPTELSASSLASWTSFYSVRSARIGSVAEALRAGR